MVSLDEVDDNNLNEIFTPGATPDDTRGAGTACALESDETLNAKDDALQAVSSVEAFDAAGASPEVIQAMRVNSMHILATAEPALRREALSMSAARLVRVEADLTALVAQNAADAALAAEFALMEGGGVAADVSDEDSASDDDTLLGLGFGFFIPDGANWFVPDEDGDSDSAPTVVYPAWPIRTRRRLLAPWAVRGRAVRVHPRAQFREEESDISSVLSDDPEDSDFEPSGDDEDEESELSSSSEESEWACESEYDSANDSYI